MAKRNYSVINRNKKMEPAHLRFQVDLPPLSVESPTSTSYLDLSQIASLLNRRFYRQGLNWVVGSIKHIGGTTDQSSLLGNIQISKLPETWVLANAWKKSFAHWQKMNNQALEESASVKPKFLDFKIYADADHHSAGFSSNLIPRDINGTPYSLGEWVASKVVVPTAGAGVVSREIIATGPNYPGAGGSGLDAVSMIEGYAASRALPQSEDPHTPTDADDASGLTPANWMAALFNQGIEQDEEVLGDMISENNQAPYPFEDDGLNLDTMYPGGANQAPGLVLHDFQYVSGTTVGGHTYLAPGCFPCGLMRIDVSQSSLTGNAQYFHGLIVELVPGSNRGYMAESMA
jgi:hypothetical protein